MVLKEEKSESDGAIIQEILGGNINAFEKLVRRYETKMISTIARRVPRQDVAVVVQETFIAAYRSLRNYSGKGVFEGWFFRIAVRECCNYWRKQESENKHRDYSASAENEFVNWKEPLKDSIENQDDTILVQKLLNRMSAEDRMLITLLFFEEMSLKDAATALNWSYVKTKVRYFRAKIKMRGILKELEEHL